jgi:hypothetical protein
MANSNNKTQRKGIIKFDPGTAKTLPISTNRKRTNAWSVEREYNGLVMSIQAFESLNAYDLIALFQMLDDYSKNKSKWENRGKTKFSDNDNFERILMYRKFDLKELCKQRNILTKKINRKTITESFDRWYKAEIIYKRPNDMTKTRYIYDFKVDKEYNFIEIIANSNFLDFCLQNGMAMNWERLTKYGKNYYALQLDIYLQFRSIKFNKQKNKYAYPNTIKEETLFNHLGIETEIKDLRHKREKVKQAFSKFKEITGQKYIYNKVEKKWIKENYLNKIKEENKK